MGLNFNSDFQLKLTSGPDSSVILKKDSVISEVDNPMNRVLGRKEAGA